MIVSNDINDLYRKIVYVVDNQPDYIVSPRGMEIKEKLGLSLRLTNPRNCLMTIPTRKLNYKFAIIEKFEYLFGRHDPDRLVAYNKNLGNFKGDYGYFDGNYAQRFNFWLDHIYEILKNDPDSRQAVISIYDQTARHQSKDIPCTLNLQFFIRDNKLNLITTMRSNDLLWGFPYDVNAFCFIQEVLAYWLNVELGWYQHNVGSMHIYLNEFYDQVINSANDLSFNAITNPKWNLNYKETKKWLPLFFHLEEIYRTEKYSDPDIIGSFPIVLNEYLNILNEKWRNEK